MVKFHVVGGQVSQAKEGRTLVVGVVACLLLWASMPVAALATTYYVDYDGANNLEGDGDDGNDENSGKTAEAPFRTIQKGIDVASKGDVIMVKEYGTSASKPYVENLVMAGKRNVKIVGPQDPTPAPFPAPELEYGRWCKGQAVDGSQTSHTLRISDCHNITIERLVFKNGFANEGGGVFVKDSAGIQFIDCCIVDNAVIQEGGGVYAKDVKTLVFRQTWIARNPSVPYPGAHAEKGGGLYIKDCEVVRFDSSRIQDNVASLAGGGMYVEDSTKIAITESVIVHNTVILPPEAADGGYGGGAAFRGTLTGPQVDVDSRSSYYLSNEVQPGNGGGVACYPESESTAAETSLLDNFGGVSFSSTGDFFRNNKTRPLAGVPQSKHRGGGFIARGIGHLPTFEGTRFETNYAYEDGGAAYFVGGVKVGFRGCYFWGNKAEDDGAALEATGWAKLFVDGCIFSDVLDSDTQTPNKAVEHGGAIQVSTRATCTVSGNTLFNGCEAWRGGAISARNSLLSIGNGARFLRNIATQYGGGVYGLCARDPLEPPGEGEGVFPVDGDCMVAVRGEVLFSRNKAGECGGAIAIRMPEEENVTQFKLELTVAKHGNARPSFSFNRAGAGQTGIGHGGIWIGGPYNKDVTRFKIKDATFSDHRPLQGELDTPLTQSALAVVGAPSGQFGAAWVDFEARDLQFVRNGVGVFMCQAEASCRDLTVFTSSYAGVFSENSCGDFSKSWVASSGQRNFDITGVSRLQVNSNRIEGNSLTPVGLMVGPASVWTTIEKSNIQGHAQYGVQFTFTYAGQWLKARDNWWGKAGGPHDPSNADGVMNLNPGADCVTDGVDYGDYRDKPWNP